MENVSDIEHHMVKARIIGLEDKASRTPSFGLRGESPAEDMSPSPPLRQIGGQIRLTLLRGVTPTF